MYADDVVLLSGSAEDAQTQLDLMTRWCATWGMKPNIKKSQVVHHRNHQRPRSVVPLSLSGQVMEYVSNYKYLGCWVNEHDNNDKTVDALTSAAGRSFGRIVGLFKKLGNMGYKSYCTLYESYVLSVANYAAGVWGFKCYPGPQVLQNRVFRYYLGTHRFAPNAAVHLEMGQMCIHHKRWLEIVRLYNRFCEMKTDRLPKKVMQWEISSGNKGWFGDLKCITNLLHLPAPDGEFVYDLSAVESELMKLTKSHWWTNAESKSKLEYYVIFRDREDCNTIVKANLDRRERSVLTQLVSGILPIEKEIGRFTNIKKEQRFCKICNVPGAIEDEYHFLFSCAPLQFVRSMFYVNHVPDIAEFMLLTDHLKVRHLLTKDKVKAFAEWVVNMVDTHRALTYKPS